MVEIVFSEKEVLTLIGNYGLSVRKIFESVPHTYLTSVLEESVSARTFLCESA